MKKDIDKISEKAKIYTENKCAEDWLQESLSFENLKHKTITDLCELNDMWAAILENAIFTSSYCDMNSRELHANSTCMTVAFANTHEIFRTIFLLQFFTIPMPQEEKK